MVSEWSNELSPYGALLWYAEAGVDEAIGETPLDRYALSEDQARRRAERAAAPPPAAASRSVPASAAASAPASARAPAAARPAEPPRAALADVPHAARQTATHVAGQAHSVDELKAALMAFDGCPLKTTATHTVFADGNPHAPLMIIGDVPEDEDDRTGIPFMGREGDLLNKMLSSIGRDRPSCYMTNVVPWRPPGKRPPTASELAVCLPFLERHIEIVQPRVLLLLGELPARSLYARAVSINRVRGQWHEHGTPGLSHPVPVIATLHPRFLLQQPKHRRLAWQDMLDLKERLRTLGA